MIVVFTLRASWFLAGNMPTVLAVLPGAFCHGSLRAIVVASEDLKEVMLALIDPRSLQTTRRVERRPFVMTSRRVKSLPRADPSAAAAFGREALRLAVSFVSSSFQLDA